MADSHAVREFLQCVVNQRHRVGSEARHHATSPLKQLPQDVIEGDHALLGIADDHNQMILFDEQLADGLL